MQTTKGYKSHPGKTRAPAAGLLGGLVALSALFQWMSVHGLGPSTSAPISTFQAWREQYALHWPGVHGGEWWRLVTYAAVHLGFWHASACALALYTLGRSIEPIIGGVHLLAAAALGSVAGGLLHCGIQAAEITTSNTALSGTPPLQGALPAAAAFLGIYSTILPGWHIGAASRLARFPIKAGASGWLAALALSIWWVVSSTQETGPHAALAGLVAGWAYARMLGFGDQLFFERVQSRDDGLEQRIVQMNWEEFVNTQLNPVLEKIAAHGLKSLSRDERRVLRQSRRKLEGW